MILVLYKLKDEENIKEIVYIAEKFNIKVLAVKRENVNYEKFPIEIYLSFDDLIQKFEDKRFIFIETYGTKYLHEVDLKKDDVFVLGAEDYGIPYYEIEKVKNKEIVKIPVKKPGSYNVVSSFVMLLTELKIKKLI